MTGEQGVVRSGVRYALGPALSDRLLVGVEQMSVVERGLPSRTGFHLMHEMELRSTSRTGAIAELDQRLGPAPPGRAWSYWHAQRGDGARVAWATTVYRAEPLSDPQAAARFMLLDVHSRLAAWYVSHSWRASDLFWAAVNEMNEGRLLPAAASARSMLEGIASFVVEGNQLLEEWMSFRGAGVPDHNALLDFRARLNQSLAQPQFATRLGERRGEDHLHRKSVLTFLEKFLKRYVRDDEMWDTYEWLCDAVHPSYGSHAAYWRSVGTGPASAWIGWTMERRFGTDAPPAKHRTNEVAEAVAVALAVCAEQLATQSPRLRWFVHDFGLTSGAATASVIDDWGLTTTQRRNEHCLCGSGRVAKRCSHEWGSNREPPVS